MARRSENRGFASRDTEQRRRIAREGGRASHGRRGRSYENDYDEDWDEDYDEDDDDRNVSNRYEDDYDDDYDDDDRYNDEDDYEDSGYEDEGEYDEDDRGWERSRQSRGGRSSSRRGFAGMDPGQQRRIARMGGEATARTHGHEFYEDTGHECGEVRDEYGPEFYSRIGRMGGRARWSEENDYDDYRGRDRSSSGGRSRRTSFGSGSSRGRSHERSSSSGRGRSSSSGRRGFGSMPREEVRRIARMGGKASHSGGRRRSSR